MQRFIYFLSECPDYPNEIFAKDKQEVVKLICDSGIDNANIGEILSEEEFYRKIGKPMPNNMTSEVHSMISDIEEPDYKDGASFMNDMMQKAVSKAKSNEAQAALQPPQPQPPNPQVIQQAPASQQTPVKYFEDHGIKFKVENGKIYKKVWTDISSGDDAEYRIIRKSSGKIVSNDGLVLEKLDWQEID